ncbi:MAG: hypothetical protein ACE5HT_16365 [Gemmatimonadales bacterium]
MAVGSDQEVYVVDFGAPGVEVFDGNGRHLRTIGTRGDGPGEFRGLAYIGWLNDTLWAADLALRRISLFDRLGNLLETVPAPEVQLSETNFTFGVRALLRDRSILMNEALSGAASTGKIDPTVQLILRSSQDGKSVHALRWMSVQDSWLRVLIGTTAQLQTREPWSRSDLLAVSRSGDRIVIVERPPTEDADSSEYRLTVLGQDGKQLWFRNVPVKPVPLSDDQVRQWANEFVERNRLEKHFATASAARRALIETVHRPRYLPQVPNVGRGLSNGAVVAGMNGMVWVRREIGSARFQHWDVFDQHGRLIAVAKVPNGTTLLEISDTMVWGVKLDEFDVPVINRYRIERSRVP